MKALIMAAGKGERMRPLTDNCPKPLLKVGGKALLDYHIEALCEAGFSDIVINAAWCADQIVEHIGDGSRFDSDIHVSVESEPLESGGGLVQALPLLGDEPFLVVNGDTYCDYDYARLKDFPLGDKLSHLVLVENPGHNLNGDFGLSENGNAILEPQYTFSGIRIMSPRIVAGYEAAFFSIIPLLKKAIEQGLVTGEYYSGEWLDIGTPERLNALDTQLSQ